MEKARILLALWYVREVMFCIGAKVILTMHAVHQCFLLVEIQQLLSYLEVEMFRLQSALLVVLFVEVLVFIVQEEEHVPSLLTIHDINASLADVALQLSTR